MPLLRSVETNQCGGKTHVSFCHSLVQSVASSRAGRYDSRLASEVHLL